LSHGKQVRTEGLGKSREDDARAEEGHASQRRLGEESDEPQAGDRDRTFGGASRRREGAVEEVVVIEEGFFIEEGHFVEEGVVVEERLFIEEGLFIEEIDFEEINFEEVFVVAEVDL
jgi:hypothetical protein